MAKYAIYRTDLGTSTARPVRGVIEISDLPAADFATRLADQTALLAVNEASIQIPDSAAFEDLDSDASTYDYTVDSTATPPVALAAVTVDRYTLAQKQGFVREEREILIRNALPLLTPAIRFTEARFADWITYLRALRAISDTEASPDTVTWPTLPSSSENAADEIWDVLFRRGNILANVGLSGGLPNGGLFETDNNTGGRYIRFADGAQICSFTQAATQASGTVLSSVWTFPAAFVGVSNYAVSALMSTVNASNVAGGLVANEIAQCEVMITNRTATTVTLQVRSTSYTFLSGDIVHINMIAFGRWAS